jgi:hypothetical protein
MPDKDVSFEPISFNDLILHTLHDMFEFGAHSFTSLSGPYFLNAIGIDFSSPMPKDKVLKHAKSANAGTVIVAHTHPLSNDENLSFVHAKIDPRERIAYGQKPLPLGNPPSLGDVTIFNKLKKEFVASNVQVIGAVFSASGIWEFDIPDSSTFSLANFTKAHEKTYPLSERELGPEWVARGNFPDYYMELEKPVMRQNNYRPQLTDSKNPTSAILRYDDEIKRITEFFSENGVKLKFHHYFEYGIDPVYLMRHTLSNWADSGIL